MTILIIIAIILFGYCIAGSEFLDRLFGLVIGAIIGIVVLVLIIVKVLGGL